MKGTTWTRIVTVFAAFLGTITFTAAPAFAGAAGNALACKYQLSFDPHGPIGTPDDYSPLRVLPVTTDSMINVIAPSGYGVILTGIVASTGDQSKMYTPDNMKGQMSVDLEPTTDHIVVCGKDFPEVSPDSDKLLMQYGRTYCASYEDNDPVVPFLNAWAWQLHRNDLSKTYPDANIPNFRDLFPEAC